MNAVTELRVPDIGDFADIPIIELLVKPGDIIAVDDPVATLESEKATLDVPSSVAGKVLRVAVSPGSRVSKGTLLLTVEPLGMRPTTTTKTAAAAVPAPELPVALPPSLERSSAEVPKAVLPTPEVLRSPGTSRIYASPSVRRIGTQLGVDLSSLGGSGKGGRILVEDVHQAVKSALRRANDPAPVPPASPAGMPLPDFSQFGEIERQPLSRIRQISGTSLARNWATIPHVTNFDEADVTELEAFRKSVNEECKDGVRLTLLSFLVRASAAALKAMPQFNASLDKDHLILKKYVHIGVAVDTPGGLLVPVIRNADQAGILSIAALLAASAEKAREGKLKAADMQGGCFTVSSLGGIGGTGFTPIINAPEVAILGAGKARILPRWNGQEFAPRLILPLSLSWDHRALDGVAAARFLVTLVRLLEDFRRVSL
jgi:pyruvate dehydrogenase E2 component (dihydrolipoamide acetyltransferase)